MEGAEPERQRGFAPFLCAQQGERAFPGCDFQLLFWDEFPPLGLLPLGESVFSAIDEAGEKVPVTDRSPVSCNTFFRPWRFYGNHKNNTTQKAAPI